MKFAQKIARAGQEPLFRPSSPWLAPNLYPSLKGVKRIAIDVETCDTELKTKGPGFRRGAYIVGLGIGIEDGPRLYYPVRHPGAIRSDERITKDWLRSEMKDYRGQIVGSNLGYDVDALMTCWDIDLSYNELHDVIMAEPLLDENKVGSYNLDAISKQYLGEGKDEKLLLEALNMARFDGADAKSHLWRLPANLVGPYAEADLDRPLRIFPIQQKLIEAEGLSSVYEIERKLLPILVRMRWAGIPVNVGRIEELRQKLTILREGWVTELKRMAGAKAELMEPLSFHKALEDRGIHVPKTVKTGQPSITKPFLERHTSDELVRVILNGRKVNTLINTFVDGQLLGHVIKGRIHPTYNQVKGDDGGTVGRLSCANPNVQFIPARDADWQQEELAPLIREIFEPEDGEEWQRDDYSQIEYRFLTHYAVGQGAEEARQKYVDNPSTSFHYLCADFLKVDVKSDKNRYRKIKIVNFCKVYGGGKDKVALTLGCPVSEAAEFIDVYDSELPFVRATYEAADRWARKRGYVVTILNRKQRFPWYGPSGYKEETPCRLFRDEAEARKHYVGTNETYRGYPVRNVERVRTFTALCRKLQVSAADLMKKAMVDAEEAGVTRVLGPFKLTVHDELGTSVARTKAADEAAKELSRVMANAVTLKVPILVDTSRGSNWGGCK